MLTRVSTTAVPDYATSPWLRSLACGHVPGDPATPAQFRAAAAFLTAITWYFSEISGPWCATTPQEIRDAHCDYLIWCARTPDVPHSYTAPALFTLHHLRALSLRRLFALSEFGGPRREEFPLYRHLHHVIRMAAGRAKPRMRSDSACRRCMPTCVRHHYAYAPIL